MYLICSDPLLCLFQDLYTVAGEFNTNARCQYAHFGGETGALVHNVAKRNDSGQNCPRAEEFQPRCEDAKCPDCNYDYINVDVVQEETILAVVGHNVIGQIPSEKEDLNLTQNFGQAEFDDIDKNRFNTNKGIKKFFWKTHPI